jgi:hypothetical protein
MHSKFLNNKTSFYILILLFLISPNLLNKLNLIDNHEIFSNLNHFENYFDYFKGHPEIITNFTTSTYRPFFYSIRGIEFFLFEDNSIFYFLVRSLFFLIICLNFYNISKIYLKSELHVILLSLLVCANPYSHDIFFRAGPQEAFCLIFFSYILLVLVRDFNHFKIPQDTKFFFYISTILMGLTKEPYVIFSIFFLLYSYFFSNQFKYSKIILFSLFFNFFLIFIIFTHYNLNGHTYGPESSYSLNSAITLLLNFFKISKIHNIFFVLQILLISIMLKKISLKFLILIIFLNIFYFSNFILTNGWPIHRYFLIHIICIYFLLLSLLYFFEISSNVSINIFFKNLIILFLIFSTIIYFNRAIKIIKLNQNFNHTIYNKVKLYDEIEIKNNLKKDGEYYLSLVIFIKNIHPKKIIIIKDEIKNEEFYIKKINYNNLYSIKFEKEKLVKSKMLKRSCFFLKELDSNDLCSGESIIIN